MQKTWNCHGESLITKWIRLDLLHYAQPFIIQAHHHSYSSVHALGSFLLNGGTLLCLTSLPLPGNLFPNHELHIVAVSFPENLEANGHYNNKTKDVSYLWPHCPVCLKKITSPRSYISTKSNKWELKIYKINVAIYKINIRLTSKKHCGRII